MLVKPIAIWENWAYWQFSFISGKSKKMACLEREILTMDGVAAYLKAGKRPDFKFGCTWRSTLDEWIAANLTSKDSGASD